jgi:universal stress protein E
MKQFKHILYVAEEAAEHRAAMERAVSLAENIQANLMVIDAVSTVTTGIGISAGGPTSIEVQTAMVDKRRRELESLIDPYRQRLNIKVDVLVGTAFLETIRVVLRNNCDLLIKPAESPSFIKRLFGSNDMHLLRKCPCPVWLTQPEEKPKYSCILAAVDLNMDRLGTSNQNLNQKILEIASSLGVSEFAELHFIHVWDAPAEMTVRAWSNNPDQDSRIYISGERSRHEKALNHFSKQLRDFLGTETYNRLSPQFHLVRGVPSRVIPETAKELKTDLVILGTVSRIGIPGFIIGNTAESILEQLQCSVIAVKPDGFVSPVTLSDSL